MVAGGGASVIYTDTVADLGYAQVNNRIHGAHVVASYLVNQPRASQLCYHFMHPNGLQK